MKWMRAVGAVILAFGMTGSPSVSECRTLEVGEGMVFSRIEAAVEEAAPGDTVLVHPLPNAEPYRRTAVFVTTPRLTIRGAGSSTGARVRISGAGFDYSGRGTVPRAIFQFNADADGCVLEGFELSGAHNGSHNGAGVRINQANDVTIRDCEIHANDMGIMSNGDGTSNAAARQLIESCEIHHNGNFERPGYNHNLYLGGWSVTVRYCDIHHSLTGHNLKSRAHLNRVEDPFLHDSGNREMDLVDARDTEAPGSHTVVIGSVIAKDPQCRGNKNVIHFGQDGGGAHTGTLFLIHSTIVTPFLSPVVHLSSGAASVFAFGSIVSNRGDDIPQVFADTRADGRLADVTGTRNWISSTFDLGGTALGKESNTVSEGSASFVDMTGHDYRLARSGDGIVDVGSYEALPTAVRELYGRDAYLSWEYESPVQGTRRPEDGAPDAGAFEFQE